jgi:hypothetical protein
MYEQTNTVKPIGRGIDYALLVLALIWLCNFLESAQAATHKLKCTFKSEMESVSPEITYIQDDSEFGQTTVVEPSGTFRAKSFMDGHILYILEKNEAVDMGSVTMIYLNPTVDMAAVRSTITAVELGQGASKTVLALTMKGPCFIER